MKMIQKMLAGLALMAIWFLSAHGLPAQATPSGQATTSANQAAMDQNVSLLRQDIRSKKKQLIATSLKLTDTEATKFWPVYDQYAAESTKLGDEKYAVIKEYAQSYGTISDEQALSLLTKSLTLDEKIAQLRSKYVPIVNKVLPGTKTATFFQMDRRISALLDVQLAAQIPLVQEQN
jgi:hypothetical protein